MFTSIFSAIPSCFLLLGLSLRFLEFCCSSPVCFYLSPPTFAKASANSFPITPACALTQQSVIFHSLSFISVIFLLISSTMYVCILLFWSLSNVVWLSVYIVTLLSVICTFSMCSRAVKIANCSAWLFVHFLFSLHYIVSVLSPNLYMATPELTPLSDLLPSVNISIGFFSSSSLYYSTRGNTNDKTNFERDTGVRKWQHPADAIIKNVCM